MKNIEIALLYVDHPTPKFSDSSDVLNARLAQFGVKMTGTPSVDGSQTIYSGDGLQIIISAHNRALPADGFLQAMESPLSAPFQGILCETLFRHRKHVTITVLESEPSDTEETSTQDYLRALRIAHVAATLVCEWSKPAAIHWRQSNQLITAAQYAKLSLESTPWALISRARVFSTSGTPQGKRQFGIRLDDAVDFIGRPIVFRECSWPVEQTYASALAFLRHAVETGEPIDSGATFGPEHGDHVSVIHSAPIPGAPHGLFELAAVNSTSTETAAVRGGNPTAKVPGKNQAARATVVPSERDRTRSMAIGFLMLVILPPVGLMLLISNVFFGSNVTRTGLIASLSVTAAVVIGAFTFMSFAGSNTANLSFPPNVETKSLTN